MAPFTVNELQAVEGILAVGQTVEALPLLQGMVGAMEAYIDEQCPAGDDVQYFSFASQFEKLAYLRVEQDPRTLVAAPAPFDRLYADYAFCLLALNDPETAVGALKSAVRWNPMDCAHRLDLAAVLANQADEEESLALSFSVFSRAAKSGHLVRAYLNFASFFEADEQVETGAACVRCALALSPSDPRVVQACDHFARELSCDPRQMDDARAEELLDAEGLPNGANVEVVLSALLLADLYASKGQTDEAEEMTWVAVDLVGQENARALAQMVREQA